MKSEITIGLKKAGNGADLRQNPINVTDGEGDDLGSIYIGLGSGQIFIENFKTKVNYMISPEELWNALYDE